MQVTTIEEARQLVGRTFERDGRWRTVVSVSDNGTRVRWSGPLSGQFSTPLTRFSDWLAGAKEVTE